MNAARRGRGLLAAALALVLCQAPLLDSAMHPDVGVNERGVHAGHDIKSYATRLRQQGAADVTLMLKVKDDDRARFEEFITPLGGQITATLGLSWFDVSLPVRHIDKLAACPLVVGAILPHPTSVMRLDGHNTGETATETTAPPVTEESLSITDAAFRASHVNELHANGLTGRDIVLAVIDTGVDPGHPDLQAAALNESKLVDWVDFTGQGVLARRALHAFGTSPAEGDVHTKFSALPAQGKIVTSSGEMKVPRDRSKSGVYHYGFINVERFGMEPQQVGVQKLAVIVVDPDTAGRYEEIYVDSDGDLDLTDERRVREFSSSGDVGWIGEPGSDTSLAYVATEILENGHMVNLGFDGNGHGTHVAGVAAANGPSLRGVAPGAKLMVLKALGSSGEGSWDNIARAMLYAAENGANIINISIGSVAQLKQSLEAENELLRELTETYGVLIVVAAGNSGPSLASIRTPGDPQKSITVGAYMTPELWELAYGLQVPESSLWHFSAVGPRDDGSVGPSLVAPGVAYSAVPRTVRASGYQVLEGTSMAVPYVSGGAALLWHAARLQGTEPGPLDIKHSLELGSVPLSGHLFAEQGYGAIDLPLALEHLTVGLGNGLAPGISLGVVTRSAGSAEDQGGVFSRGHMPGSQRFTIENNSGRELRLRIPENMPEVDTDFATVHLPADSKRQIQLRYPMEPLGPGVTEFAFTADDDSTYGPDLVIPHTVVTPVQFPLPGGALGFSAQLGPNQVRRYFVEVPAGTQKLRVSLAVPGVGTEARGRVRVHITGPDGLRWGDSQVVGREREGSWVKVLSHPEAGIWEFTVQGQPDLSHYQLASSDFELRLQIEGIQALVGDTKWVVPGSSVTRGTTLRAFGNTYTGNLLETALTRVGAGSAGYSPVVHEQARIAPSDPFFEEFELAEAAELVELVIENCTGRSLPKLYLYRYDGAGNPVEVAAGEEGDWGSRIIVRDLEPGRYLAWVETRESNGISIQYRRTSVTPGPRLDLNLDSLVVAPAFELRLDASLDAPKERGRYRAYVVLMNDEQSRVLQVLPVEMAVGPPGVLVQVRPATGSSGNPTLARVVMRDRDQRQPVEVPVRINGRYYQGYAGTGALEVPATPRSNIVLQYRDPLLGWVTETVVWPGKNSSVDEIIMQTEKAAERRTKLQTLLDTGQ